MTTVIEPNIVARVLATTALAFGVSGSAAVAPPNLAQEARCPYQQCDVIDADVIREVPAARTRTIWL